MTHTVQTIGELLRELFLREADALKKQKIKHAPTIGKMYEAFTAKQLQKHLPSGLDLSVVSGFASGYDGTLSRQLDCMIVTGEGESLAHISEKVYPVHKIVAVIEVKANLYTREVAEGHDNLKSVLTLAAEDGLPYGTPFLRQLIKRTLGPNSPEDLDNLSPGLQQVYGHLMLEAKQPLRILLGYHGYKGEAALRKGIIDHIDALEGRKGYTPGTLPSVILSPHAVAIKAVGMPWVGQYEEEWWHLVMTSETISPVRAMVEAIWWRLGFLGLINDDAFAGSSSRERWNRLLSFRYVPEAHGWEPCAWSMTKRP
jgi:hypothetical protein